MCTVTSQWLWKCQKGRNALFNCSSPTYILPYYKTSRSKSSNQQQVKWARQTYFCVIRRLLNKYIANMMQNSLCSTLCIYVCEKFPIHLKQLNEYAQMHHSWHKRKGFLVRAGSAKLNLNIQCVMHLLRQRRRRNEMRTNPLMPDINNKI